MKIFAGDLSCLRTNKGMDLSKSSQISRENDGKLLATFVQTKDERCFEELVRRHSGMVTTVCSRATRHEQDAKDVLQAVFVTLARKAKELTDRKSVAGWLYYVARNISWRLNESKVLREIRENEASMMIQNTAESMNQLENQDLRTVLDAEIEALPEKYRLPIILHHFEEKTVNEVAEILGLHVKAVEAQISRARTKLRKKLVRRGFQVSMVTVGGVLAENASATISPELVTLTTKTAINAVGKMAGLTTTATVTSLANQMIRMMFMKKIKTASLVSSTILVTVLLGIWIQRAIAVSVGGGATSTSGEVSTFPTEVQQQIPKSPVVQSEKQPEKKTVYSCDLIRAVYQHNISRELDYASNNVKSNEYQGLSISLMMRGPLPPDDPILKLESATDNNGKNLIRKNIYPSFSRVNAFDVKFDKTLPKDYMGRFEISGLESPEGENSSLALLKGSISLSELEEEELIELKPISEWIHRPIVLSDGRTLTINLIFNNTLHFVLQDKDKKNSNSKPPEIRCYRGTGELLESTGWRYSVRHVKINGKLTITTDLNGEATITTDFPADASATIRNSAKTKIVEIPFEFKNVRLP
jgi:RNA polymerase sigma factor (sigma-70 family)